ncbi:unnamed protein product [Protopolystoma xenopodis]|uniref:Uncharacterized protein n=1 Tax=Protopolystoma xenopodis TaxID=117903 RepID=A0A448XPL6_9PLAT|nr:unnamed protein product [Protopolystoma xenopodis]
MWEFPYFSVRSTANILHVFTVGSCTFYSVVICMQREDIRPELGFSGIAPAADLFCTPSIVYRLKDFPTSSSILGWIIFPHEASGPEVRLDLRAREVELPRAWARGQIPASRSTSPFCYLCAGLNGWSWTPVLFVNDPFYFAKCSRQLDFVSRSRLVHLVPRPGDVYGFNGFT